jgi:anti-sigma B factor antagonist
MKMDTNDRNEVKVVEFEGNLDTNTATEAEQHLNTLFEGGASKILVNFKKLDYISSAGLRVLLATAKKLKGGGGELRICELNETVQEVFEISGFSTILNVFKNETEALENF